MIIYLYHINYNGKTLYLNSTNQDLTINGHDYYAGAGNFGDIVQDLKDDSAEIPLGLPFSRVSPDLIAYAANAQGTGLVELKVYTYNKDTEVSLEVFTGIAETFGMSDEVFAIKFKNLLSTFSGLGTRLVASPSCMTELYSTICTMNKASFTYSGTITNISSDRVIITASVFGNYADNWFRFGYILCENEARLILAHDQSDGTITLIAPFSPNIEVDDTFSVYAGCDKMVSTCVEKFNNIEHFFGFPYAPLESTVFVGMKSTTSSGGGSS